MKRGPKPDLFVVDELDDITPEAMYRANVEIYGPRCAAWLIRTFRRRIRKTGCVFFRIPEGEELPGWFRIAKDYLAGHRRWEVEESREDSKRVFVIGRKRKPIPAALVPAGTA